MNHSPRPRFAFVLAVLVALGGWARLAAVQTLTWTGAVDGNWSNAGNWSPTPSGLNPSFQSNLIFDTTASTTTINAKLCRTNTITSITFNANAPAYTMHVPALGGFNITNGGVTNNSANTQTLSIDGSSLTFNTATITGATLSVNGMTGNNYAAPLYLTFGTSVVNSTILNNAGSSSTVSGGFTTLGVGNTLSNTTVINNGGAGSGGYISILGDVTNSALIANGGFGGQPGRGRHPFSGRLG